MFLPFGGENERIHLYIGRVGPNAIKDFINNIREEETSSQQHNMRERVSAKHVHIERYMGGHKNGRDKEM